MKMIAHSWKKTIPKKYLYVHVQVFIVDVSSDASESVMQTLPHTQAGLFHVNKFDGSSDKTWDMCDPC